jgi:hypothetical protein
VIRVISTPGKRKSLRSTFSWNLCFGLKRYKRRTSTQLYSLHTLDCLKSPFSSVWQLTHADDSTLTCNRLHCNKSNPRFEYSNTSYEMKEVTAKGHLTAKQSSSQTSVLELLAKQISNRRRPELRSHVGGIEEELPSSDNPTADIWFHRLIISSFIKKQEHWNIYSNSLDSGPRLRFGYKGIVRR